MKLVLSIVIVFFYVSHSYAVETYLEMTNGGDDRLHLDPASKLNKYLSSTLPVEEGMIMRSSSTSSRPSSASFNWVNDLHQGLSDEQLPSACAATRNRVKRNFVAPDLYDSVHVICTPSGTDAEMLFSALALSRLPEGAKDQSNQVCNIVLAAGEVGSGTDLAAGLRHFSPFTPFSNSVVKGAPIAGAECLPVEVKLVVMRNKDGELRAHADLETEVEQLVKQAREKDQAVVVHMVHSAKTGVGALDDTFLSYLKREHGDNIILVADLAQGRFADGYVSRLLSKGVCVLLTGSKFFGGAPFSGVVLIPDLEAGAFKQEIANFPEGLADYFSAHDVDESLPCLRAVLSQKTNRGLMLRWETAVPTIETYYSYSEEVRNSIAQYWVRVIKLLIRKFGVHVESVNTDLSIDCQNDYVGQANTIISFFVKNKAGQYLGMDQLKTVHSLLVRDISKGLPNVPMADCELRASTYKCLLGQPVELAPGYAALRISLSAPMIVEIVSRMDQGQSLGNAVETLLKEDEIIFEKLAVIMKHFVE